MRERLQRRESAHFILWWTRNATGLLVEPALEALEAGYRAAVGLARRLPRERRSAWRSFRRPRTSSASRASRLPRSRPRAPSPSASSQDHGALAAAAPARVSWRDTLNHEYLHYLQVRLSANRAPIRLQEGVARYGENRWRSPEPADLEVVRAQPPCARPARETPSSGSTPWTSRSCVSRRPGRCGARLRGVRPRRRLPDRPLEGRRAARLFAELARGAAGRGPERSTVPCAPRSASRSRIFSAAGARDSVRRASSIHPRRRGAGVPARRRRGRGVGPRRLAAASPESPAPPATCCAGAGIRAPGLIEYGRARGGIPRSPSCTEDRADAATSRAVRGGGGGGARGLPARARLRGPRRSRSPQRSRPRRLGRAPRARWRAALEVNTFNPFAGGASGRPWRSKEAEEAKRPLETALRLARDADTVNRLMGTAMNRREIESDERKGMARTPKDVRQAAELVRAKRAIGPRSPRSSSGRSGSSRSCCTASSRAGTASSSGCRPRQDPHGEAPRAGTATRLQPRAVHAHDLMPSDITGTEVLEEGRRAAPLLPLPQGSDLHERPLADEIKPHAAEDPGRNLLKAMQE